MININIQNWKKPIKALKSFIINSFFTMGIYIYIGISIIKISRQFFSSRFRLFELGILSFQD